MINSNKTKRVLGSVLDYPHKGLDQTIWDDSTKMLSTVRKQILTHIEYELNTCGFTHFDKWIDGIRVIGSITGYQYNSKTDIDIHIRCSLNKIIKEESLNIDEDKLVELLKEVRKEINSKNVLIEGTNHPIEITFEHELLHSKAEFGIYDIIMNEWVSPPKTIDIDFDVSEVNSAAVNSAKRIMKDMDTELGESIRDIKDIDQLKETMDGWDGKNKKVFKRKLDEKIKEIEDSLTNIVQLTDRTIKDRHTDYDEYSSGNIKFKYLQRYGYVELAKNIAKHFADEDIEVQLNDRDINTVKQIVKDTQMKQLGRNILSDRHIYVDLEGKMKALVPQYVSKGMTDWMRSDYKWDDYGLGVIIQLLLKNKGLTKEQLEKIAEESLYDDRDNDVKTEYSYLITETCLESGKFDNNTLKNMIYNTNVITYKIVETAHKLGVIGNKMVLFEDWYMSMLIKKILGSWDCIPILLYILKEIGVTEQDMVFIINNTLDNIKRWVLMDKNGVHKIIQHMKQYKNWDEDITKKIEGIEHYINTKTANKFNNGGSMLSDRYISVIDIMTRLGRNILSDRHIYADLEGKMKVLISQYVSKGMTEEEARNRIIELNTKTDPTGDIATYTSWIVKLDIEKTSIFPDDSQMIYKELVKYNKLRNKPDIDLPKDIHSFPDFPSLAEKLDQLEERKEDADQYKKNEELLKTIKGIGVVYNSGNIKVVKIKTPEASVRLTANPNEFGTSFWCVNQMGNATSYLNSSPLYCLLVNNIKTLLAHEGNGEIKDPYNRQITKYEYARVRDIFLSAGCKVGVFEYEYNRMVNHVRDDVSSKRPFYGSEEGDTLTDLYYLSKALYGTRSKMNIMIGDNTAKFLLEYFSKFPTVPNLKETTIDEAINIDQYSYFNGGIHYNPNNSNIGILLSGLLKRDDLTKEQLEKMARASLYIDPKSKIPQNSFYDIEVTKAFLKSGKFDVQTLTNMLNRTNIIDKEIVELAKQYGIVTKKQKQTTRTKKSRMLYPKSKYGKRVVLSDIDEFIGGEEIKDEILDEIRKYLEGKDSDGMERFIRSLSPLERQRAASYLAFYFGREKDKKNPNLHKLQQYRGTYEAIHQLDVGGNPHDEPVTNELYDLFQRIKLYITKNGVQKLSWSETKKLFPQVDNKFQKEFLSLTKNNTIPITVDLIDGYTYGDMEYGAQVADFWAIQAINEKVHQLALVINNDTGLEDLSDDTKLMKVVDYIHQSQRRAGHPYWGRNIGWLRLDVSSVPGTLIIDEVQSDTIDTMWALSVSDIEQHQMARDMFNLTKTEARGFYRKLEKRFSTWLSYAISTAIDFARRSGLQYVAIHTSKGKKQIATGMPMEKGWKLYDSVAKQFGFAESLIDVNGVSRDMWVREATQLSDKHYLQGGDMNKIERLIRGVSVSKRNLYETYTDVISKDIIEYFKGVKRPDGLYDFPGDVNIVHQDLYLIPKIFNTVNGDFNCFDNELRDLRGCPSSVGGNFICSFNKLQSLYRCPKNVGGDFNCSNNFLKRFDWCPESVDGHFNCSNNQLKSLDGCPKYVGENFDCSNNLIKFTEEEVRSRCNVGGRVHV